MKKRRYDPENDSPEARANWETRHIYNIYRRKYERDKLLEKYRQEKVVRMYPDDEKTERKRDLFRIKTELDWFASQTGERYHREICQCGTEKVIAKSSDPGRMRAVILSLVFIDQFVHGHYRELYRDFSEEFPIPKLRGHSFGGNASPSWLVYPNQGFDKLADWPWVEEVFECSTQHLRRWLREKLNRSVPGLCDAVNEEVKGVFKEEHHKHIRASFGG